MIPVIAPLADAERYAWLRLTRSEGVGPRTFVGLIQRFGTAAAAVDALPRFARLRGDLALASTEAIDRELDAAARHGWRLIALNEPDYPPALRVIDTAPPLIAVRGQVAILQRSMAAIVGSRNASAGGALFTERLARGLGAAGLVVVSGLARGIDAKAHQAALGTGTVAVLAGGHTRVYPAEHAGLAERIAETGAVVSEMPFEWEPRGRDFPRRNRIVSGLALGTVVVEAARRSGSLITARFANEQGREVFAVPGSPLEPRAEGTNDLIRQGATLCTRSADVVDALGAMRFPSSAASVAPSGVWDEIADGDGFAQRWAGETVAEQGAVPPPEEGGVSESDHERIAKLLGQAPVSIDDLVRLSGQGAARLRAILVDLEFDGLVMRHPGDLVSGSPEAAQARRQRPAMEH